MKQKQHKPTLWFCKKWMIYTGLITFCTGCIVNVPLPSSSNPAAKAQNQAEADLYDDDCFLDCLGEISERECIS